jgi:hypothetical protein
MMLYVPVVLAAGVPLNVPVPFPLSTNVTPLGNAPDSLMEGRGRPNEVTLKVPAVPIVSVVPPTLVIVGA